MPDLSPPRDSDLDDVPPHDVVPRDNDVDDVPTTSPDVMLFIGRPFTATDALSIGISARALRRLVREGTIRPLMACVYVDAAAEDTPTMRAQALFEVVDEHAVVCDRSAAWLHGLDVLGPEGQAVVPPLEVYRTGGHNRTRRRQCKGGKRTIADTDIARVRGIPVTTPLRTALDLGRLLRRGEAIGAIDALLRLTQVTVEVLAVELPRFKGARGVVQLRQLIALADARAESMAESKLRLQIHDAGLPRPEVQWRIFNTRGHVMYRIDLAYPSLLLAIEYDGRHHHTSLADRARDSRRRAHLQRLGWTVLVLTANDVYGPDPRAAALVSAKLAALSRQH